MPLTKSCWSQLTGCMQTGVWVSGDCTQTDSKALRAIWCLSNSQLNSRNLKHIMRAHHASISCKHTETVKGGLKCVLKPSHAEGGKDVCSAGGLSQIHTVIQMAKMMRLFHKQVHYLKIMSGRVLTKICSCNTQHSRTKSKSFLFFFTGTEVNTQQCLSYFAHLLSQQD